MSKSFWYLLCSQTHGSCTASATGAVCEVRRPPAGHLVGARQSGFGFHGIARISQLRRNAGIISGKRVVLGGVTCVITARAGRRVRRASPRARAVGELGRKRRIARRARRSLYSVCVSVCVSVCSFRARTTRARGNVLFHRSTPRPASAIPKNTTIHVASSHAVSSRFFRSPQRRKVHAVVQGLASRAAARAEAA